MSMAALPPPHTFLPGFERIKKLLQNKSGGSGPTIPPPPPPPPPRGYAPGNIYIVGPTVKKKHFDNASIGH